MPGMPQQEARAEAFRNMHRGRLLLLPNAWDVASARIFEDGGFAAIATTSAGIAFTLGYPDGERVSRQEMLTAVGRMPFRFRSQPMSRPDMAIVQKTRRSLRGRSSKQAPSE